MVIELKIQSVTSISILSYFRREVRKGKSPRGDDEEVRIHTGSPHSPRPPSRDSQRRPGSGRHVAVVIPGSGGNNSGSQSSLDSPDGQDKQQRGTSGAVSVQTGQELLVDYDPVRHLVTRSSTAFSN